MTVIDASAIEAHLEKESEGVLFGRAIREVDYIVISAFNAHEAGVVLARAAEVDRPCCSFRRDGANAGRHHQAPDLRAPP